MGIPVDSNIDTAKLTAQASDVTAPVTTPVAKTSSIADPEPVKVGSVRLRGVQACRSTPMLAKRSLLTAVAIPKACCPIAR